jgi:hypothetical protein
MLQKRGSSGWPGRIGFRHGSAFLPLYLRFTELGIEPLVKEWEGTGSPLAFIASMNLHRRHLSASQAGLARSSGTDGAAPIPAILVTAD